MAGEGEAAVRVVGGEVEVEASTAEPGITAHRSSGEWGSRSCWERVRHD